MFAIEIIVAMEGIIVIKVWHNCFAYQGGFLLSLSVCISTCNGFQHKIYQFSVGAPFTPSVAYLHIPSCPPLESRHSFSVPLRAPGLSLAPISSRFLTSAPFLSRSICKSSCCSPPLARAEGSMSERATYCNHWPIPQPSFGPWPPFPWLQVRSFISAERL